MDVKKILKKHSKLNFVKRILDPHVYPNVMLEGETEPSTHKMTYGESDGKYYAYPTIIQKETGELIELDKDAAWKHAMDNKEYIEFKKEEEASDFAAGGYKQDWDYKDSIF